MIRFFRTWQKLVHDALSLRGVVGILQEGL